MREKVERPGEVPLLVQAIGLAVEVHHSMKDKAGRPYILHPLRVMLAQDGDTAMIVAVLHDVVEDTRKDPEPYTFERLRALGYPEEVLAALDCVTNRKGESYDDFVERAASNPIARKVKLADLEDNLNVRRLAALGLKETLRINQYLKSWRRLKGAE